MLQFAGLLLIFCLQAQADDVPIQANFDARKYAGKWYGIALASNCSQFLSMKDKLLMPVFLYITDRNGGFTVKVAFNGPQKCEGMKDTYQKIQPGHYTSSENGESDNRMVWTDYDHFALEYTRKVKIDGEISVNVKLFGRTSKKPAANVLKRFHEFSTSLGLTDKNIVMMPKGVECDPRKV
ncbi:olfactory protein-like [Discoglossus pictus]